MIKAINVAGITTQGSSFKLSNIKAEEITSVSSSCTVSWTECIVDDIPEGAKEVTKALGIAMDPSILLGSYLSGYEDRGEILGLMFPVIMFAGSRVRPTPMLIYISKDHIVTIQDEHAGKILKLSDYASTFFRKLPTQPEEWAERQTTLLIRIIDELSEHNFTVLRMIVESAEQIEIDLAGLRQIPRDLSVEMSNIKTSVMRFLNAIWATHTTVHSLRYGDPDMVSDNDTILAKFDVILAGLERQIEMSEHVLAVLTAGMNVLQTEVSNKLGSFLLWLTVIGTAILVPNTLATIYGAFPAPEDASLPRLLALVVSTVGATYGTYWFVHKWWQRPRTSRKKRMHI
ncbi:MAG TPA: CorA family divalent cation transporter [Nitrososphaerales archaeon]|nr:CorA family divalent cation transporter [Nitrososphaerales archaeon]